MKDISGTWQGITKLIETKNGPRVINVVREPFGQYRTRMYLSDIRGMVLNWDPIVDVKSDVLDNLIKKFEVKTSGTETSIPEEKTKPSKNKTITPKGE